MKAKFEATNADEMEFSMTITMKLEEWKCLKKQLKPGWPAWELSGVIFDMVCQAEKTFCPKIEDRQ